MIILIIAEKYLIISSNTYVSGKSASRVETRQKVAKAPKKTAQNVKKGNSSGAVKKLSTVDVDTSLENNYTSDKLTDERVTELLTENNALKNKVSHHRLHL